MKQSNLLNAQFARRLFRTAFSSWQLLAVMLIVCMNVAVGSKLYAQSNTIAVKGKVMADGEPVIGATVLVKGVSTGTATDMDGNFSLNVASKAVLVVSSIGYETQEVPVNGRQFINVVLKSDVVTLKDVVVVGYGVQKKVNLTGAVSSVSTDELEGKPISNVLEAMQGTTPGLVIQQGSSTPGSVPSINIRGLNTMNNNDPLVIIDGIEGSLGNLNPADIEQISILKDASSTAIYGSRASNGVVLVTTKKGKAGKVEISYDFMYGVQQPTSLPKIADSWVYAVNSGRAAKFTPEQIAQFRNGGPNVNWVKELYHRNSPQSSHNVSMTGGNDQLSYMASLGYMDQNSMFKGPDYGYKRYNARLNVSHKVTNNFTLNLTSQFARNDIKEHAYWTEWIIEQANRMPPIYPIKNAKEEGVEFLTLHNPIEYIADEQGCVKQVILQKMELGEPDASGRRSPVAIPGATETIDIDLAIVSVGVSPNPIVPSSIKGLELGRKGTITVDDNMESSIPMIYAGGDIVRGGATVILAMGDGRKAAAAMNEQLKANAGN